MNQFSSVGNIELTTTNTQEISSVTRIHDDAIIYSDWTHLLWTRSFCSRIFILLMFVFLCILSFIYCFGQIYKLQLSNYWCPVRTLEQIREHSIDINSPIGDDSGCWTSKNYIVNK